MTSSGVISRACKRGSSASSKRSRIVTQALRKTSQRSKGSHRLIRANQPTRKKRPKRRRTPPRPGSSQSKHLVKKKRRGRRLQRHRKAWPPLRAACSSASPARPASTTRRPWRSTVGGSSTKPPSRPFWRTLKYRGNKTRFYKNAWKTKSTGRSFL